MNLHEQFVYIHEYQHNISWFIIEQPEFLVVHEQPQFH